MPTMKDITRISTRCEGLTGIWINEKTSHFRVRSFLCEKVFGRMIVAVIFLDYPSKGKNGYGSLGADTVFRMLEYSTDTENSIRKMRQKEGIALVKERGIIFGRQEKSTPEFQKAYNMWRNKEITAQEAADMCGIHTATFYRRAQKMRK